ncbi:MAG: hypothetical protein WC514_00795 [Candidatus Paceibacterota bacterium]
MGSKSVLLMGIDALTMLDLLKKAAAYKGLKLQEGASAAYSEPVKVYELDDKLLAVLAERGIRRHLRPDAKGIFTLADENFQEKVPGYAPSNYWNFKLVEGSGDKFNLYISLVVGFRISTEGHGIVLWPRAQSPFLSPVDRLPNFRMFKALAESDKDAPAVVKELAASDGSIVVTWSDLGLGGIRRIESLFVEFTGGNGILMSTINRCGILDPYPIPRNQQPGEELFITESARPKVLRAWRAQLKEFRDCLEA